MKIVSRLQDTIQTGLNKMLVYGRMIKFSHSVFALPFALSAVVLAAQDHPLTFWMLFWIAVAMVAARSSAMGFNRIVDATIDGKNPRTRLREIPSGKLSMGAAILFVCLSGGLFILAASMLGALCFYLSFPVLAALYFYSFTKRFSWLCHIYLGMAIALAPAGAWVAVTGSLSFSILLLSAALLTHIGGFDILYACQDIAFDHQEGLQSMPVKLGPDTAMKISSWLHVGTWLLLLSLYVAFDLNGFYLIVVFIIGILLIVEHKLVNPNDLTHVNIAFFHINSIISLLLFIGILGGVL